MAIMSSILSSVTRCPLVSGIVSPFGAPMRDGQSVLIRHCYRRALGLEQGMSGITAPDPPAAADLADTSGHAEHYPVVQKISLLVRGYHPSLSSSSSSSGSSSGAGNCFGAGGGSGFAACT